jgi:restriction system protein
MRRPAGYPDLEREGRSAGCVAPSAAQRTYGVTHPLPSRVMGVPDFQTVMRPVLAALEDGQARSQPQLRAVVADRLEVSDDDQLQMLPSGKQTTFGNRVAWALTHMAKAGLIDRPVRGRYVLTDRGRAILAANPRRVDMSVLNQFPEYQAFRAIKHDKAERRGKIAPPDDVSPSEAVGTIVEDSYDALAEELLDRVLAQPPVFLETLSLRLLRAMGYGGREATLEHTGKPGDAGLDGLVRQDALGLDLVGVQAKRYDKDSSVNRPEVQGFVGALQGAQTSRGVFVTTGRFSPGAKQFAEGVPMRLVLIDGAELTKLMVRYNVGVSVRESFELKQADEEFFEE